MYKRQVYIRKTDGSPAVLLGEGGAVSLSPDGKWVVAQTQASPSQLKLLTTGAGEPKALTNDDINHSWAHWFPDGKRLLFSGNEPGKGVKLYVFDVASGKSHPISPEGVNGTAFIISPDSQWVAAVSYTHLQLDLPRFLRALLPGSAAYNGFRSADCVCQCQQPGIYSAPRGAR